MSSSPIATADANHMDPDSLYAHLARVPDPRAKRGCRYSLSSLLTVALGAVMAGAQSYAAIGEWAADLNPEELDPLGLRSAPEESGLRKLFARLDTSAVEACLATYMFTRTRVLSGRRVIAIDGKTLRGAKARAAGAPHLLAAIDHDRGVVVGQSAVEAKTNEIPAARDLITSLDPDVVTGSVITLDAMHTQTETANLISDSGADYVFTVKGNQPTLRAQLKALLWERVPGTTSRERHRGGRTTRTIKVINAPDWVAFPHAVQVAQLRRTRMLKGEKTVEVVDLITSMDQHAAPPDMLTGWVRSHWTVENRLHWVRDVTFDEDRSQVRTGESPQVMAAIRNTVIGLLRLSGVDNIARARRRYSRHTDEVLTCLLAS